MKEIKFALETITPMFLGGADGKSAELRPPSIKGLMRFWWRVVNAEHNIAELQKKENRIFGGGGEQASKSSFSIKIIYDNIKPSNQKFPNHPIQVSGKKFSINILEYLAYGTYDYRKGQGNVFNRDYLPSDTKFDIFIYVRKEDFIKDILISFYFLSAFGGLGSRTRNGFGGFNVLNREAFSEIGKEYVENILPTAEMLRKHIKPNKVPNYSALSSGIKLFRSKEPLSKWDDALAEVGKIYKSCRESLEDRHQYNKRQYIGAPLDPPKENFKSILDRHSKPYFIRIIKEGKDKFNAYILYLPSKYCEGLKKDRKGKDINYNDVNRQFESVCNEFNELLAAKLEVVL